MGRFIQTVKKMCKKQAVTLLSGLLLLSPVAPAVQASEGLAAHKDGQAAASFSSPTDIAGHWAEEAIRQMSAKGYLEGYEDGTFRPGEAVTRAQFAAIVNRLFGLRDGFINTSFRDVDSSAWYAADVAAAKHYGMIEGYADYTFKPDHPIQRQDAAVILENAFKLNKSEGSDVPFSDRAGVAEYAARAVQSLVSEGYMTGYQDNLFRPAESITRAETVALVSRIAGNTIHSAGEYTLDSVKGNVVINTPGVTIRNAVIEGNLYLAAGIGEGEVTLEDVIIKGRTHVEGGGANSVHFNNTAMAEVMVGKQDSDVRVVFSGTTTVDQVQVMNRALLETEQLKGEGVRQVMIQSGDSGISQVKMTGEFGAVQVEAKGTELTIGQGSRIQSITAGEHAANTSIRLFGNVGELRLQAPASVELDSKASVDRLEVAEQAAGTVIEGSGKVGNSVIHADGVQINGKNAPKGTSAAITPAPAPTPVSTSDSDTSGSTQPPSPSASPTPTPVQSPSPSASPTPEPTPTPAQPPSPSASPTPTPTPTPAQSPSPSASPTPTTAPSDWTLVWGDEFNDTVIDTSKWTYDLTNGTSVGNPGWGNNELEYYTDRPENVKEEGGSLVISAIKEPYQGFDYTSARIKTKGLYSKAYGKFEIRAKAPTGKGLWPAIWMLPETYEYGGWAASGEIDIMEGWGSRPHDIAGTIHYGQPWPGNTYTGKDYTFTDGATIEDFHTYAIEWEPGEIRWYVDGIHYSTQNDWYSKSADQPANNAYPAPFDQPFHLLMNLAVGGNFDGNPAADLPFPKKMEIDYVRVYELTGRPYREPVPPAIPKEDYPAGSRLALPDGNMIYNSGFTQSPVGTDDGMGNNTPTAYWDFFTGEGGQGFVAIDTVNGVNYAKVNITSGGSQVYSVQPQAIVSLAKGRYYKLSFDARSDTARSITVKATGGASTGWAGYSGSLQADLTQDVQHYEMSFQMKRTSDPAARIEFNMGTNNHPVWIGNAKLVEVDSIPFDHDSPKMPLADGNHVYNGTFNQGEADRMSFWHVDPANLATVTKTVYEGELQLMLIDGGSAASDVKLLQKGVNFINGQDYKVTFDASDSAARTIEVELAGKDGTSYGKKQLPLTVSRGTGTVTFDDFPGITDSEGQLIFYLGGANGMIRMDNIKLIRTSIYFDPNVVFYPLVNGDFTAGMNGWGTAIDSGGAITGEAAAGEAKLTVLSQGSNPWSSMFVQDGLQLSSGVDYIVSFDARSTANRKLEVIAENSTYTRFFDKTFELTSAMQNYSFEFKMTKNETVSLKFLLGLLSNTTAVGSNHDVFIDNVVLEVKGAPVAKPPMLMKDISNNKAGQPIELTFVDDSVWRGGVSAVKINGDFTPVEDYSLSEGVLRILAGRFPTAGNYTISVEAAGYAAVSTVQNVLENDGNLLVNGSFSNGKSGWETWSGEGGTADLTVQNEAGQIWISSRGNQLWANQFFQSGIPMASGKTYELSFKASSSAARPVIVEFTGTSGGSATFNLSMTPDTVYTKQFTVNSDAPLKLNFLIGNVTNGSVTTPAGGHTIFFDDIAVKEVTTPVGHPLQNGNFDTTIDGWVKYTQDGSDLSLSHEAGALKAQFSSVYGANPYSAQIYQAELQLDSGKTYVLSFDVSASAPKNMLVSVENGANYEIKYLNTHTVGISASVTTVTYEFTMSASDSKGKLIFQLGTTAGDAGIPAGGISLFLDNISLVEKTATLPSPLENTVFAP
jgi:beta-glucanase (GH16 family)